MALQAILDSLNDLPEAIAAEYVERDGKFVLDVTPVSGFALEDVTGLKKSLSTARSERDKAVADYKTVTGKLGDADVDELLSAAEKLAELGDDADLQKRVEAGIASREEKLLKRFEAEKEALVADRDSAASQLENILKRDAIHSAIDKVEGSRSLLEPIVTGRVRMKKGENGLYMIEVLDEDGQPAIGDAAGNPMTIPGLLEELKGNTDYAGAFPGSGNRGSGSKGGQPGTGNKPTGGIKVISSSDDAARSANLEGLADGTVVAQ